MKLLLRYHLRLGDIIKVLSIAMQLDALGNQVWIECNREYHSIFKLCPYAMPAYPGQIPPKGFKFDHVLNLQIWPDHYNAYRASKLKWWDFVTSLYPSLQGCIWSNPFELSLLPESPMRSPEKLVIIANTGFSQVPAIEAHRVYDLATRLYPNLTPFPIGFKNAFQATDLCDLVSLIHHAGAVVTINTSIDYMADATRESYDHVINTGFGSQDDFESDKQIRHSL